MSSESESSSSSTATSSKKCTSSDDLLDNLTATCRQKKAKKWLNEFDIDIERGMECLQDGTWPLLATNWPSFLYAAEATYDSEDLNIGLFRGHAFQHLYLGPAAAGSHDHGDDDGKHSGSKSKHMMYGLTKVTPQSWAWAMCAVWFSLSACNLYKMCIGSFNLEEFFFAIIKTLDDPKDPWAVDMLAWINEQVFGKHATKGMTSALDDADSDLAKMRAKHVALLSFPPTNSTQTASLALSSPLSCASTPPTFQPSLKPQSAHAIHPKPTPVPPKPLTVILPKPMPAPVVQLKAKPIPKPKPVPKPHPSTHGSMHLAAGCAQVEEPTNEPGDSVAVEAPVPQKKNPVPRCSRNAA
ncbi:uncharacterized protein EDB91DRAFT_1243526 [Suillus paluster]|uniref:uncharacterized protein n=1 Tax=Suillus paluster TaxID=48578 RepID=UPI001B8752A2|nr:uncharacterized protein EDB91DRAFT_1243526 [Suillus paluster]KAG1751258.1 hypothetical protein EDB91DRAFT_1243526 [Suillus paluster]